jgi:RHH-type rel operon transcriptional repressor/antitoxin RelB
MAVSIRLEPEIELRLDHLAAQTGRSKSYYLRELIECGMDDLEDFYLSDLAMQRVRKGTEQILSAEQVRKNLELDRSVHRVRKQET